MPHPLHSDAACDEGNEEEEDNPHGSTSSIKTSEEFDAWLQKLLIDERTALFHRLQEIMGDRMAFHHSSIYQDLLTHCNSPCLSKSVHAGEAVTLASPPTPCIDPLPIDATPSRKDVDGVATIGSVSETSPRRVHSSDIDSVKVYRSEFIAGLAMEEQAVLEADQHSGKRQLFTHMDVEFLSGLLILLNIAVIAAEAELIGCSEVGKSLDILECRNAPSASNLASVFNGLSIIFTGLFGVEFFIRLLLHGRQVIHSGWMWFDLVVLSCGFADCLSRVGLAAAFVNPIVMRLARVARMLRAAKVFRSKAIFQTLFLLVKAISASGKTLVWFILIIFFAMTCVGLLLTQLLWHHMSDLRVDKGNREEIYIYFGTYSRVLVTMFELTLGNWAPVCRLLMTNVSHWWGLFVVAYRCMFCFSLVHVTVACFVTETSRVAADDQVQMMRKVRHDQGMHKTLREVFKEIDSSGDGFMTLDELREACDDKVMKDVLELLNLELHDVEDLFALMDTGNGQVPQEEFVDGILRLRGEAKCSTQVAMMTIIKQMAVKMDVLFQNQRLPDLGASTLCLRSRTMTSSM